MIEDRIWVIFSQKKQRFLAANRRWVDDPDFALMVVDEEREDVDLPGPDARWLRFSHAVRLTELRRLREASGPARRRETEAEAEAGSGEEE
ncbi:MAG TPA: hypothetical protein VFG21_04440 [Xanthomonadaceae bacterium]|nr:hypothetical protein [Xanthomonadaceae bacterium]